MTTARLLTIVLVLQGLILAGQWLGGPAVVSPAAAQIPDAGAQQLRIIEELKDTNTKLDKIIALLEGGKLQVQVVMPDEKDKK